MANQLLLIEDVDDLGRSGDVVKVKPGYSRNYLLPQKKALIAGKHTVRMQAKLKEERAKLAEVDKKEAEVLSRQIETMVLSITVKVDQEGHLYGSVSAVDIIGLFENQGIKLERRNVVLPHPIKELGVHKVNLKLKEGVPTTFTLNVESDIPLPQRAPKATATPTEQPAPETEK